VPAKRPYKKAKKAGYMRLNEILTTLMHSLAARGAAAG